MVENYEFSESMLMKVSRNDDGSLITVSEIARVSIINHDGKKIVFKDKQISSKFIEVLRSWDIYTYSCEYVEDEILLNINNSCVDGEIIKFYSLIISFLNNDFKMKDSK